MPIIRLALISILSLLAAASAPAPSSAVEPKVSQATQECLECHAEATPAVEADWRASRHAEGDAKSGSVGCAECHTRNPEKHPDTFEHNGFQVHVVVSPADCAGCHRQPADEFDRNMMAHAHANLIENPIYMQLASELNAVKVFAGGELAVQALGGGDLEDSCLACHGTRVEAKGLYTRQTAQGEMEFVKLAGWPNQGVGRINPDGSLGACTACHPRHRFSIATARKPYTCSQCHKGLDVPAYRVYSVSKHGNIFMSQGAKWNFEPKEWTVGRDFSAPTCAGCHISRLVTPEGEVTAQRTHQLSDRLDTRLFGPIYAVRHPAGPKTHTLKNRAGLSLPVELADGRPAPEGLISVEEAAERRARMKAVCSNCHSGGWVDGHFARLDKTIAFSNELVRAATAIQLKAWRGGINSRENLFDETIERLWTETWLFYANSIRLASAMAGADYGVFDNGRWQLSLNLGRMKDLAAGAPEAN